MIEIRTSTDRDRPAILSIINAAAEAYRGVIPPDRWHDPYMPDEQLARELADGVRFWIATDAGLPIAVMGLQDKGDVTLVRHAYVVPSTQRSGVGSMLLRHVERLTDKPVLIGTWRAASWAIRFYERNGFNVVPDAEKDRLLRTYWSIPDRQIATSVVLAKSSGKMSPLSRRR
jgi:GNAT superfamily N-acetyltransferase